MIATLALLAGAAAAIYWACEYFVNGVEWVGARSGVGQIAVGSILAAFGTALPESVVTFVAVVFGPDAATRDIGVGAALGGPLVLGTLAYSIVGCGALARGAAARSLQMDAPRLRRDQGAFLIVFALKATLGWVTFPGKRWFGLLFLLIYGWYLRGELGAEDSVGEAPEPLKLWPRAARPPLAAALAQTLGALAVIYEASRVFVAQIEHVGPWLGLAPAVTALLLSPIATELPETMNALIWVRQRKERLALANISGSMMIQATIPSALGLLFTPWRFDAVLTLAAVVTALSIAGLYLLLRRNALTAGRMSAFGAGYLLFGAGLWWLLKTR